MMISSAPELTIVRTFDAPAALVFSMWSNPEHFAAWMGPEGFTCPVVEIDFRVGGAYRALIVSEDTGDSWFWGVYREIERPSRLTFTLVFPGFGREPIRGLSGVFESVALELDGALVAEGGVPSTGVIEAIAVRRPSRNLLHHSVRGSQYCSDVYLKLLKDHGFAASMSGIGNCYDNSMVQTVFKTIKAELIWRTSWRTRDQAQAAIARYIDGFYNPRRRHSALGYQSPIQFESHALKHAA